MQIDTTESIAHAIEMADLFAKPLFDSGRPQLGDLAIEMGLAVFSRMVLSDEENIQQHIKNAKIYLKNHSSYMLHRQDFMDFLKTDDFANLKALVEETNASEELKKSLEFNGYYRHAAENWDGLTYDTPYLTTIDATRNFAQMLFNNPPADFYETFLYAQAVNVVTEAAKLQLPHENPQALDLASAFARPLFDQGRRAMGQKCFEVALPIFASLLTHTENLVPITTLHSILQTMLYVNGKDTHPQDFSKFLMEKDCWVLQKILEQEMGQSSFNMKNSAAVLQHVAKNWDGQHYKGPEHTSAEDRKKYVKMIEIFNKPHDDIYDDFLFSRIQKFIGRVNSIASMAQKVNAVLLDDMSKGSFLSSAQVQEKIMQRREELRQSKKNSIQVQSPEETPEPPQPAPLKSIYSYD